MTRFQTFHCFEANTSFGHMLHVGHMLHFGKRNDLEPFLKFETNTLPEYLHDLVTKTVQQDIFISIYSKINNVNIKNSELRTIQVS